MAVCSMMLEERYNYMDEDAAERIDQTIKSLIQPNKVMYASEENADSLGMQLEEVGINDNEINRDMFRQLIYSTPDLDDVISGISMCSDNINLKNGYGQNFREEFINKGIIVGMRLDNGLSPALGPYNEFISLGLDRFDYRCGKFKEMGLRYATWTCVLSIGKDMPTTLALKQNSLDVAYFVRGCQHYGLLPVVQVEVSPAGNHDTERCQATLERFLDTLISLLQELHLCLGRIMLTTSFVCHGNQAEVGWDKEEIAKATLTALSRTVPPCVPAIAFTSSGLPENLLCVLMEEIFQLTGGRPPWKLTFHCTRSMQKTAIMSWRDIDNTEQDVQLAFKRTLTKFCLARSGRVFKKDADLPFQMPRGIYTKEYIPADYTEAEEEEVSDEQEVEMLDESLLTSEEKRARDAEKAMRKSLLDKKIAKGVDKLVKKLEQVNLYSLKTKGCKEEQEHDQEESETQMGDSDKDSY